MPLCRASRTAPTTSSVQFNKCFLTPSRRQPMSGQRRTLVIGGSVGGLFAAHMLRSIGWDVVVFERSGDNLVRRGAGIGASGALFAAMQRIGVPFDASDGIAVMSRVWLESNGNIAA